MNKILQSSANPEKLALTVKGILTALIPILIFVFAAFGLNIGSEELTNGIGQLTAIISGAMILWGLVRKFILWVLATFKKE